MNILDPLTLPLSGQQLIEASAGTGKTYTITSLVLRLLLGDDCDALSIDQILVVTFTNAATAELRARVRDRVQMARHAFLRGDSDDPFILALMQRHRNRELASQRLDLALQNIDEAPIYTIHGFCQRVLQQNAFESGVMFETEFLLDEQSLRLAAAADFWRRHFYTIDSVLAREVLSYWRSPEELLREVSRWLGVDNVRFISSLAEHDGYDFKRLHDENIHRINALKQAWLNCDDDLFALIQSSGINKNKYKKNHLENWLAEMQAFAASATMDYTLPSCIGRFSQTTLDAATNNGDVPRHSVFGAVAEFLAKPVQLKDCLLQLAIKEIGDLLAEAKQRQGIKAPDDLLRDLAKALDGRGDSAQLLAQRIRQQYPVAMIDEFQDTDDLQYAIYRRVYAAPESDTRHALLMIGDPKQAIYAFRGADIFSYIGARRQTPKQNIYTLDANYRSTAAVVEAINVLFSKAEHPFIFSEDIEFNRVRSAGGANQKPFTVAQRSSGLALHCLQQESREPISKEQYQDYFAGYFAADIFQLLHGAQGGEAQIDGRAIRSRDIAVLVRDRHEAQRVKQALAGHGIGSVFISEDSVFDSAEAQYVFSFLLACCNPRSERRIKTALAGKLFALNAQQLDALNEDPGMWNTVQLEFEHYHHTWQENGVMAVFLSLFMTRDVPQRILRSRHAADSSGERVLTNILHLVELLQVQSTLYPGPIELLQWFSMQLCAQQRQQDADAQQLRLESDQNLVQIVTIHKSKGLEYNIVYLPFAVTFRSSQSAIFHDVSHAGITVDLTGAQDSVNKAERERLAEDLRLLYVALTRAVYRCELGVCDLSDANARGRNKKSVLGQSALGYLLLNRSGFDPSAVDNELTELEKSLRHLTRQGDEGSVSIDVNFCDPKREFARGVLAGERHTEQQLACRTFNGTIESDWWITSYSALSRQAALRYETAHGGEPPADAVGTTTMAAGTNDHRYDDIAILPVSVDGEMEAALQEASIFTFPRGANAGTFMHTLFELLEMHQWRSQLPELVAAQLRRFGFSPAWQTVIETMVADVLLSYLDDASSLRLADVQDSQRLTEMEFFLPLSRLRAPELQACLAAHGYLRQAELQFDDIQGMLKGFIDLVFCHDGRYFVLDYKSNFLGGGMQYYSRDAMQQAINEHLYDLQYLLYSVALHRYLRQRMTDYDYQRHFGGVYYLFLRGMRAADKNQSGIFFDRPSLEVIVALDRLLTARVTQEMA